MLGIIIGVGAVILLISVGQGLQNYITTQFEDLGANQVYILPGNTLEEGSFGQGPPNFSGSKLTIDHAKDIEQLGGPIKTAAVNSEVPARAQRKGESLFVTTGGVSANMMEMTSIEIEKGRPLSDADVDLTRNVAVIGQTVVDDLFGTTDPVGEDITIGGEKFKVIGVLGEISSQSIGVDMDSYTMIPITASQKMFGTDTVQTVMIQARSKEDIEEAMEIAEEYMLKRLDEDDFSIVDQSSLLDTINNILGVLTAALGGIAAISLVVGGVGIMNIMLVSVTERTREIGLRKAIGAKPNDILMQFLIEAVTLSVVGGTIGIAIGWGGSLALNTFFPTYVTPWAIALAFGVSAAIGIIFGVAPALRASKLDPIDALRYE
jgi:putative ABC transport system permease protein